MKTTREAVAVILRQSPELRILGLKDDAIYQAETVDSPTPDQFPFLVLRWGEEEARMGNTSIRPFDLLGYDKEGDYTRIENLVTEAVAVLERVVSVKTDTGWLQQMSSRGRGGDLADDGFNAVVIPHHMVAVASGV